MVFHPKQPNIFLVGTEEGFIFKCSTEFSSRYLMTYHAHYLPVYRIDINKYNANIFVSCGADWRVKIWEDMRRYTLFICFFCAEWPVHITFIMISITITSVYHAFHSIIR